jgi:hypothetical protein
VFFAKFFAKNSMVFRETKKTKKTRKMRVFFFNIIFFLYCDICVNIFRKNCAIFHKFVPFFTIFQRISGFFGRRQRI